MSISPKPSINLEQGLAIGYGRPLATSGEQVEMGEGIHYLLARNGRGKTTLLRTLAGLLKPVAGGFRLDGHCQFISDELYFDRELSARRILSSLLPRSRRAEAFALAEELELDLKKPFGKLSTGNRKKVGLLIAEFSVGRAKGDVILFDEPFTGLDAPAREAFVRRWRESRDGVIRLASCHPDFDGMEMESALLITDGSILHGNEGAQRWIDIKNKLN